MEQHTIKTVIWDENYVRTETRMHFEMCNFAQAVAQFKAVCEKQPFHNHTLYFRTSPAKLTRRLHWQGKWGLEFTPKWSDKALALWGN